MATLAQCISRTGTKFKAIDRSVLNSLIKEGSTELEAVDKLEEIARRDLSDLIEEIENQGGVVEQENYLDNAPDNVRPISDKATRAAQNYALRSGRKYISIGQYVTVDKNRAEAIAAEFEKMKHDPDNPEVKKAYQAMINETIEQFRSILDTGLDIDFITGKDPYTTGPAEVIDDVNNNNHMWVYPTDSGFGSNEDFDPKDNPLLAATEFEIKGHKLLANDVFRIVHDYFGHIKNGVGFRANGEENAWQSHAAMYSNLARRAMTTETRGQNSWLNFGPHGEKNRTAKTEDTIFADQKIGLMPEWTSEEGRLSGAPAHTLPALDTEGRLDDELMIPPVENGQIELTHYSRQKGLTQLDPSKYGTGFKGAESKRKHDESWLPRTYHGIEPDTPGGYKKERALGNEKYVTKVPARLMYDMRNDPDSLRSKIDRESWDNEATLYEKAIYDAGYLGYYIKDPSLGMVAATFEPLAVGTIQPTLVLSQSSVGLRKGRESLRKYGLKAGVTYTTREVASAMEARTREKSGIIERNDRSVEARNKLAKWIVQEIKFEMEHPEHSGLGWYSEKYQRAIDLLAEDFPELATDQVARDNFTALLAITSDGEKVKSNFALAYDLYVNFRNTEKDGKGGKFHSDKKFKQDASVKANLKNLQTMYDEMGAEAMHKFLMKEGIVKDLKKEAESRGLSFNTDYPATEKLPMAATVLGDKLGAFYGNLMGSHGYLTMDRWWSRSFNRYRGLLVTKPTEVSMRRFAKLLRNDDLSNDEVLIAVIEPRNNYHKRKYWTALEVKLGKKKSKVSKTEWKKFTAAYPKLLEQDTIERAANTIYKAAYEDLENAPFNPSDRKFMIDTTRHAQKSLSRSGVELSIADIQAVLWYYEKRLYDEMGARGTDIISFEEAAALAMGKSVTPVTEPTSYTVLNQPGWHGTNAKVDKMSTEYIGTGEGNQAYGWGLYFSDLREIAEWYRKKLSGGFSTGVRFKGINLDNSDDARKAMTQEAVKMSDENLDDTTTLRALSEIIKIFEYVEGRSIESDDLRNVLQIVHDEEFDTTFISREEMESLFSSPIRGSLYKVELAPAEDEYLLWDKPLSEQSDTVRKAIESDPVFQQYRDKKLKAVDDWIKNFEENGPGKFAQKGRALQRANERYETLKAEQGKYDPTGSKLYRMLYGVELSTDPKAGTSEENSDHKAASEYLHALGVRGVKYLDGSSRAKQKGSFNYVIFNEDDVEITERYEQFERGKIYLNDANRIIQLTNRSDLSSFLHESAHLFLDMERIYANRYGVSEDQQAMLDWMGVSSFNAITEEEHEKWAETFEVYLRTGKAPSLGLRRAFSAFTRWLKVIYRSLTDGRLARADLNPEITGVFDRLLATSEEIEEISNNPEYDQYYRSKEQAGMSDAQWVEYSKLAARAKDTGERTIDEKVLKQYMARKTEEWDEEKAPLIESAREILSTLPVYEVLGDLRVIKDEKGEVVSDGRLDNNLLKAAFPDGKVPKGFPVGKAVNEGGQDPALYAEAYGFKSVSDMVNQIIAAPSLKVAAEEQAEQEMVAKYGDILNDGSLEQEVKEALLNDDHAAMLMLEINAKRRTPGINRAYLKSQAQLFMKGLTYKEIRPDRHYKAMIKAAKASVNAEDPTDAKIQQLSNHYMYKEALDVKERMDKNRRAIKAAKNRKYNTKQIDSLYVQRIQMLAAMYDERKSPEQLVTIKNILEFYNGQLSSVGGELTDLTLLDPNLVRAIEYHEMNNGTLEGFELVQVDDMTAEDLQGVVDMLDHLRYVGKQMAEMNGEEAIRLRMEVIESVLSEGGKDHKLRRGRQTKNEDRKRSWNHLINTMPSLANMVKKLDGNKGGGKLFNSVYQLISGAIDTKFKLNERFYDEFKDLMGDISTVNLSRDSQEFTLEDGTVVDFSSEAVFMMGLYWGTESSRDAIREAWGLTDLDVHNILSSMTTEQLHLVNTTWAMNESQWPELRDAAITVMGVAPPKLDPAPFVVNGVMMSGGHMALVYDHQATELKNEQESASKMSSVMPSKANSLHARQGSGGKKVKLDIHNITRSVDNKIHYIAFAETGRKLRQLLNHDEVKSVIEQKHGPGFLNAFIESVEGITGGRVAQESHKELAKISAWMRHSASLMHLGYSIRNTVQQPAAVALAMKDVGPLRFAIASARFLGQRRELVDLVNDKSQFMKNRAQVVNRESAEFMKQLISTSKAGHNWEKFKSHAFILQTAMDSTVAYPTWLSAYEKAMEEHGEEKRARTEADTMVAQSVGSGSDLHLGRIMQSNNQEYVKTLTVFGSWFNAYYQRLYKSSKGGTDFMNRHMVMDAIVLPVIVANITQALVMDFPDDDETVPEWFYSNTWQFLVGTLPVIREIGSLINGFTPIAPINTLPQAVVRFFDEISAFIDGRQSVLKTGTDVGKITTSIVKVPGSGQMWRMLDYLDSYMQGNEDPANIFTGGWQMLTEGPDKNK